MPSPSPISSNPALNLLVAARDVAAGPSGAGATRSFSDMLERNMRQQDQGATRPREATQTPNRPSSAESSRPAPAQRTNDPAANAQQHQTPEPDRVGKEVAAEASKTVEDAAPDDTEAATEQDGAASATPDTPRPDTILTAEPSPDPAENDAAVAASLAALAPVLAGIAAAPESDAATTEGELPATPTRTLASTLMARLFGNTNAQAGAESGTTGTGVSGDAGGTNAKLATAANADAKTDFAALVASKQTAAAPVRVAPELNVGIDPAARLAAMAGQPVAESGTAGLLHASTVTPTGTHRADAAPQLHVATPAGQRAWAEDVGTKLTWMVGRGESRAELVLTPPNLGKVGVSIHVNGDQTTAHFVAATPAAREALEQAMPRLREVMQQSGINLGQTDVSTSSQHQAREDAPTHRSPYAHGVAAGAGRDDASISMAPTTHWVRGGTGVIDTFA